MKIKCKWCSGKKEVECCSCNNPGRYGDWECARGYCGGHKTMVKCKKCKGTGKERKRK